MKKDHGSRRTFLKSVLAGSAVAAGVVATGRKSGTTEITAAGTPAPDHHDDEILLRDTEEFRCYYQSLREC